MLRHVIEAMLLGAGGEALFPVRQLSLSRMMPPRRVLPPNQVDRALLPLKDGQDVQVRPRLEGPDDS